MRATLIVVTFVLLRAFVAHARDPEPDSDVWLTNAPALPGAYAAATIATNRFANLKAEIIAGKLLVRWETTESFSETFIVASADAPGHWPARDWRSSTMRRTPVGWVTDIPIDSLDVPVVYFAVAINDGKSVASPMRITHPRALGLETPTRLFWPFVEGFEQGTEGWRTTDGSAVRRDVPSKSGRASLVLRVPAERRSATLMTTRLRGWFLEEHEASGVMCWLRMKSGVGTARFALFANAWSTNQFVARRDETVKVTEKWTPAALRFESFPRLALGDVDLFSVELTAEPGAELLIDDVQLLGRWLPDY